MAYDFQQLEVWKLGMELVVRVYKLTTSFPATERYALVDQMKRAANSVIANIAEATGRHFTKDRVRVLYQARGEIEEVKSHLVLAKRLKYGDDAFIDELLNDYGMLGRRLNAFIRAINTD